jgi:5-methylcytosine-specific restriction enzyme subunit McrC
MDISRQIPIQNLYYILCYAWNLAEQRNKVKVDASSCKTYPDLFAKLLVSGCQRLFKLGLYHEYVPTEEERYGVKGKLNVSSTIKKNHWREGRLDCVYDEYSDDVLLNQIIYASLKRLLCYEGLAKENRDKVKRVYLLFPLVKEIELSREVFDRVHITRNNRFYGLLIHICQLIYESLLPDEKRKGKYNFVDFSEEKMNRIFENFLFNFYKKECSGDYPKVERSNIQFQLMPLENDIDHHLPKMITDVTLINREEKRKIILDAKYYFKTFVSRFDEPDGERIRRDHISQVLSYVLNQEDNGKPETWNANGILVYPKVDREVFETYRYRNTHHKLRICTIDLGQDWTNIESNLKRLIVF